MTSKFIKTAIAAIVLATVIPISTPVNAYKLNVVNYEVPKVVQWEDADLVGDKITSLTDEVAKKNSVPDEIAGVTTGETYKFIFNVASLEQSYSGIKVFYDGTQIKFADQNPFMDTKAGRVLVPIRAIAETVGWVVTWDAATRSVTFNSEKYNREIKMTVGNTTYYVDGVAKTMNTAPFILNGRTLVPVRFVAEAMGKVVKWNGSNNTVIIETVSNQVEMDYQAANDYYTVDRDEDGILDYMDDSVDTAGEGGEDSDPDGNLW